MTRKWEQGKARVNRGDSSSLVSRRQGTTYRCTISPLTSFHRVPSSLPSLRIVLFFASFVVKPICCTDLAPLVACFHLSKRKLGLPMSANGLQHTYIYIYKSQPTHRDIASYTQPEGTEINHGFRKDQRSRLIEEMTFQARNKFMWKKVEAARNLRSSR